MLLRFNRLWAVTKVGVSDRDSRTIGLMGDLHLMFVELTAL